MGWSQAARMSWEPPGVPGCIALWQSLAVLGARTSVSSRPGKVLSHSLKLHADVNTTQGLEEGEEGGLDLGES